MRTVGHDLHARAPSPKRNTCVVQAVLAMATAGNGHSKNQSRNPLAVHLGGLQNLLRLRTNYRFNEKLAAEVGADFNVQQQSVFPVAELEYQVSSFKHGVRLIFAAKMHHAALCSDSCEGPALGCLARQHPRL